MFGFVVILFSYFLSAFIRVSPTIVMPIYQQIFGLTPSAVGLIAGIFFIPYGFMQMFAGPLCQKYGLYRISAIGQLLAAIGLLLFAFAKNALMLFIGRFLIGAGMGPVFITVMAYVQKHFSGPKYALVFGIAVMISNVGAALSAYPLQYLLTKFGVSSVFIILCVLTVIIMLYLWIKSLNEERDNSVTGIVSGSLSCFKSIIKNYRLRCCLCAWILQSITLNSYQALWSTKWTSLAFPNMASVAGLGATAISIGIIIGSPISERLHHKINNSIDRLLSAFGFVIVSLTTLILSKSLFFAVSLVADFVYGIAAGDNCTQMASFIREESDSNTAATITGMYNGLGCFSCQLFQWGSGAVIGAWTIGTNPILPYATSFAIPAIAMVFVYLYAKRIKAR